MLRTIRRTPLTRLAKLPPASVSSPRAWLHGPRHPQIRQCCGHLLHGWRPGRSPRLSMPPATSRARLYYPPGYLASPPAAPEFSEFDLQSWADPHRPRDRAIWRAGFLLISEAETRISK